MKLKHILPVALGAFLFASCSITTPLLVTDNAVGKKTGVSSTTGIFGHYRAGNNIYHGMIFNGKFGIADAAKNGGVSKIGSVDYKVTNYVLFNKQELIVSGE